MITMLSKSQLQYLEYCVPQSPLSTSSDALLLSIPEAQLEEQMADDVEANNIEEPPSPVMQQGLLQKELVRNYGSNSHPHRPTFLKPPPSHHS
ncbi:hypothetical protein MBANPS3_001954 [Mucor bainieri]